MQKQIIMSPLIYQTHILTHEEFYDFRLQDIDKKVETTELMKDI